jgi:3-deoxy-D-manno-octulosonate 8-phosphate phosphatase (KDO 8-P phosphatase)
MILNPESINLFKGDFITDFSAIKNKLRNIKAFIFDWDGVFNNGQKNNEGHSTFSEIDSMGINLMRFNSFLFQQKLPITAIITGEKNELAFSFAKRENFNAIYFKAKNKETALLHFCKTHQLTPAEIMFVYDDILDFSVAKLVGVRMMVQHTANPLTIDYAKRNRLVDYITYHDGNNNALREISELVMLLSNNFQKVVEMRTKYSPEYTKYITTKSDTPTLSYTADGEAMVQI